MAYTLRYSQRFAKAFKALPADHREHVYKAVERLGDDPFPRGKSVKRIKGPKDEFFRLRVGDYRVLYSVRGECVDIEDLVYRSDLDKAVKRL